MIKSNIRLEEVVENKNRKFGANLEYYPTIVCRGNGPAVPALFTENEIETAIIRANKNPEDCPEKEKTFWQSIFGE